MGDKQTKIVTHYLSEEQVREMNEELVKKGIVRKVEETKDDVIYEVTPRYQNKISPEFWEDFIKRIKECE